MSQSDSAFVFTFMDSPVASGGGASSNSLEINSRGNKHIESMLKGSLIYQSSSASELPPLPSAKINSLGNKATTGNPFKESKQSRKRQPSQHFFKLKHNSVFDTIMVS